MTNPRPDLPVAPADRFFLLFDGVGPPVAGCWMLLLDGPPPGEGALLEALAEALRRYPKAGCVLESAPVWHGERLSWREAAGPAAILMPERPSPGAPPLAILGEIGPALFSAPLSAERAPLVELHRGAAGERGWLALRFHHALADGYGAIAFLTALSEALGGAAPQLMLPPAPTLKRWGALYRLARRRSGRLRGPIQRLSAPGAAPDGGIHFRLLEIGPGRLIKLRALAKEYGFDAIFGAAWAQVFDREAARRGEPAGRQLIFFNQGGRASGEEGFDNRSGAIPVDLLPGERGALLPMLARLREQIEPAQREGVARALASFAPRWTPSRALTRRWLLASLSRGGAPGVVVSNLGRLPPLSFGGRQVVAVAGLLRPAEGTGLAQSAVGVGGSLWLALSALGGLFSAESLGRAAQDLDEALAALEAL